MTKVPAARSLRRGLHDSWQALPWRASAQPVHPWSRLSALIDGIYAIAATLLVLELRPPAAPAGGLGHELLHQWPEYFVYALGFVQIAAGWLVMRRMAAWCRGIDHYATLLVLGCVATFSLTPFTTAVLAGSVRDAEDFRSAVRLMAVVVVLSMALFTASVVYLRRRGLFRDDLEPIGFRAAMFLAQTSSVLPAVALGLSFLSPHLALGALVVYFLTALWPIDPLTTGQYAADHR